jgi:hypothetical protein
VYSVFGKKVIEMIFHDGSVPIKVAARVFGKEPTWVRAGIICGWLPIGKATRNGKTVTRLEDIDPRVGKISYYVSPKLLYEETGYIWKGEKS